MPLSSSTHLWSTPVALLHTSSLLMMVYAPDRRLICLDITSSSGRIPSTRKSLNGCAHDGALTTAITTACRGCASSILISELPTVATVTHSAAPGDICSSGAGTSSMQSAVPDDI